MRRVVPIVVAVACALGALSISTIGSAGPAAASVGLELLPPSVASDLGVDTVPACVSLGPCEAAGELAPAAGATLATAGAGFIAGFAAGTGAVAGVKFVKDKWFTFHPEGQAGPSGIISNIFDISLNNYSRDANNHPSWDTKVVYKFAGAAGNYGTMAEYGLVDGTIVPFSDSGHLNPSSGTWWQVGYTENTHHIVSGIGNGYSVDDMDGVYLNVRDTHGNFVATVNVPWANIKPIWHLQTDYICHTPGGSNTSGVQDGGTFESPIDAPSVAPAVTCPAGSYVVSWHTHVSGPDGDYTLLNWDAPVALTDPNGPYASCLKLAGGSSCGLQRHQSVQAGQADTCTWGAYTVALSDCDFDEVLASWESRTRIQAYGEFLDAEPGDDEKFTAVDQCLAMATVSQCKSMPIFLPGADVFKAAQHDAYAITVGGKSPSLTYAEVNERAPDGWYNSYEICATKPAGTDCDEYPFRSTQQGGPGASLRPVISGQNQLEGRLLGKFFQFCGVDADDRAFLVIPLELPAGSSTGWNTQAWCRPQGS